MTTLKDKYIAAGWTPDATNSQRLYRTHLGKTTVEEIITIISEYRVDYEAIESGWFRLCWADYIPARETLFNIPWYISYTGNTKNE
jgi:hypothetical protein